MQRTGVSASVPIHRGERGPRRGAAVRLRFRGGLERTLPVTSNFWVTEVPIGFERSLPLSTVWLGPNGETIKEFGDAGI